MLTITALAAVSMPAAVLAADELPMEEHSAESPEESPAESTGALLTDAQRETARALAEEASTLSALVAGEDYLEDSAVFCADSLEEAERVAKQYGAQLESFSEGVAVLSFGNKGIQESLSEISGELEQALDAEELLQRTAPASEPGLLSVAEGDPEEEISEIDTANLPEAVIYPNYLSYLDVNPDDDPLFHTSSEPPYGQWFHDAIHTEGAWAMGADGSGIKVAVIDSGIDTTNNDLSCGAALYVKDSIFKKSSKYADYVYDTGEDENGHGTHCAGIIAGLDNSLGGVGIAPGVNLISIRAASSSGALADSDIAAAIQMAIDEKADIISMSFSGNHTNEVVKKKIEAAQKAGILCVASAGNEGSGEKSYPACYDGVICVGAYAEDGALASFSNYGFQVTLAAPGSDILSTMVNDDGAYMRKQNAFRDTYLGECSYGKLSGTSMAVPVAAGVAALVKSVHKDYSVKQLREALVNSARDKVYASGSRSVKGGIDAYKAVAMENADPSSVPVVSNEDYLCSGVGPELFVKAGKSVLLRAVTSLDKKNKLTYVSDSETGMITVDKTGKVMVNKKAAVGESAAITIRCATLTDTVKVTVLDGKTPSAKFSLKAEAQLLSVTEGVGINAGGIFMTGGDSDRPYTLVLSGNGIASFQTDAGERNTVHAFKGEEGELLTGASPVRVIAKKSGTATLTAYAADGSGLKASVKIKCVIPLTEVSMTYKNVPIRGSITMAQGAILSLKALGTDAEGNKAKGSIKYTWSGKNVKNGRISAPKRETSFPVTVRAECEGFSAERTITVSVPRETKAVSMGYFYLNNKGKVSYLNSYNTDRDSEGKLCLTGFPCSIGTMPDLSEVWLSSAKSGLKGPIAFTKTGNAPQGYDNSTNESGRYIVTVSGPKPTDVVYGDYGVTAFTPAKAGKYRVVYTSLDGSGKSFSMNLKVSDS